MDMDFEGHYSTLYTLNLFTHTLSHIHTFVVM